MVFENRVLTRIFGPKRNEMTGDWRKLHNLHPSPNIIRMMRKRKMRWAEHVALLEKEECI
jgi:predicted SAM-dependent methyltransferase